VKYLRCTLEFKWGKEGRSALLKILDDHDQERQLDAERFLRISGACDKIGAHL
jgi:hypothetical protein